MFSDLFTFIFDGLNREYRCVGGAAVTGLMRAYVRVDDDAVAARVCVQ